MRIQCSYCQTDFGDIADQGQGFGGVQPCPQCGRPLVIVEDDKPVNTIVQMNDQGRLEKI